ncbi:MAG: ribonuclease E/G, partial [Alphaproteobacteria bacterium]
MEMILSRAPGQVIAALMGEHGMEALEIVVTLTDLEVDARLRHRDIVLARVLRVVKGAGGVLVDLGRDGTGFLPAGQPVLTRRPRGEGWQTTDRPQEGQTVLAQVARLAQAGGETAKGPRLTGEIQVPGRACVYRLTAPADQRLRASRQMDASAAALLRTWIDPCLGEGDGFVLRTAAARLEPDAVVAEASALRAQGLEVLADARDRTPPYRVWRDGPPIARILRDWVGPAGARITVDDAILARTVEQVLTGGLWPDIKIARLPHGRDCDGAFDIEGQIEALTARHVPLSGGGSVVIDSTEALTAIDVNGGGQTGLEANLEAAREIARQIRLRDIGGLIVVGLIDLQGERQRERGVAGLNQGLGGGGAAGGVGA